MKVYVTTRPEDAVRHLAGRWTHVIVRRQRFWRPVVWFRPNLIKDLACYWHWDSPRRSSQKPKWDERGGVLLHYPYQMVERGYECDAHVHEQCPTSVRLFAVHTAFVQQESILPLPTSWDHLRRSVVLRFPNRITVEAAYDRIRAQRRDVSDVRSAAACRECEADPRNAAVFTGSDLGAMVGLGPRDIGGIVSALFGFRSPKTLLAVLPRIRPLKEPLYDFIEAQPELPDGWRLIKAGRLLEQDQHYRATLTYLAREGYILRDPALHVYDFETMNPDFGRIEEVSKEKMRLLESMIRFVESLPELPC